MYGKNDKKHRVIKHFRCVQRNKHYKIRYFERHAKSSLVETICCVALQRINCLSDFWLHQQPCFSGAATQNGLFWFKIGWKSIYWLKGQPRLYWGNWKTKKKQLKIKCNNWVEGCTRQKKKKRFGVWGYTNSEYLYMLHEDSLTLKYKTYTIKSLDDAP